MILRHTQKKKKKSKLKSSVTCVWLLVNFENLKPGEHC